MPFRGLNCYPPGTAEWIGAWPKLRHRLTLHHHRGPKRVLPHVESWSIFAIKRRRSIQHHYQFVTHDLGADRTPNLPMSSREHSQCVTRSFLLLKPPSPVIYIHVRVASRVFFTFFFKWKKNPHSPISPDQGDMFQRLRLHAYRCIYAHTYIVYSPRCTTLQHTASHCTTLLHKVLHIYVHMYIT